MSDERVRDLRRQLESARAEIRHLTLELDESPHAEREETVAEQLQRTSEKVAELERQLSELERGTS